MVGDLMATYVPVVVVPSGGVPFTQVFTGAKAPALTVVDKNAFPITLTQNASPIALFNPNGTVYNGAVSPSRILGSALIVHWDGNRADLITRSGAEVTSWKDVVAGYDKVQAVSAARPLYSSNSFNGSPCVDYDASNDQLTLTGVPALVPIGAAPCEIWTVIDNEALGADATTRRLLSYGGLTNNNSRTITLAGVAGVQRLGGFTGTGASASFSANPAGDAFGRHATRTVITATGISSALDGGALTLETAGVSATSNEMIRSGLGTGGTGAFNGKIRHILITSLLSGDQVTSLWAWAATQRNP